MSSKPFTSADFRKELLAIMPGYMWTVHRPVTKISLVATGIQSSGFNRLSTLEVTRRVRGDHVEYEAISAGHGTKARFRHSYRDGTLARALRGLQQHYERQAAEYRSLAAHLKAGRTAPEETL